MEKKVICTECGGEVRIIVRMSGNRFSSVYLKCRNCHTEFDNQIDYDNDRTEGFD